jgi:Mg/Co/Ni transporter MgtE
VAIAVCLVAIVFISVLLGAILPLAMKCFQIDPAHSSTTIQVVMDILGGLDCSSSVLMHMLSQLCIWMLHSGMWNILALI